MLIKYGLVFSNIIVKKYSIIFWENIHIFSSIFTYIIFVLYNIIYIYHFTNGFYSGNWTFSYCLTHGYCEGFCTIFFSVFFKVILKIFCVCQAFSSFLCLVFLVPFMLTLHLCCERYLSLDHVIKKEWET